jgi:flagellar basal-body rod modification protein FlgD
MAEINGVNPQVNNLNNANTIGNKELGQKDFLELLVAQMKNQDPLNPQTNGEFLSQLAQFSSVDGISKMQQSLENLANSLQSNQALQASALVGRKVYVPGSSANLSSDSPSFKVGVDLPVAAANLSANIYSSNGELVKTIELGSKIPGFVEFEWDGVANNGQSAAYGAYTIKVEGLSEGKTKAFGTMIAANVDSVSLGQNGEPLKLNVAGIGQVSLSDVKQITA